jgi:hypothetical protein
MIDRVGQQLCNYRLGILLGQGGYTEVYLGQYVRFKQQERLTSRPSSCSQSGVPCAAT